MKIDRPAPADERGNNPDVAAFLAARGWLSADERVLGTAPAGEGNMNLVLRVTTTQRSLILKQARPWVEKYPQIAAPVERAEVEAAFYRAVAETPAVAAWMPRLIASDGKAHANLFEDLGDGGDSADLYRGASIAADGLVGLVRWLAALHTTPVERLAAPTFSNRAMRALNHQHVFALPLDPANGIDLDAITPGLGEAARRLRDDACFAARTAELGRLYLADGGVLLHGDFFPGSWLRRRPTPKVVDPEFCFVGPPEWDLGVMWAHLLMAGAGPTLDALLAAYGRPVDRALAEGFAGVEIMRRLIGVAQLPLDAGLERKRELLDTARALVTA